MSVVSRLAAIRYLRTLKRAGAVDPDTLAGAKTSLISYGENMISPVMDLLGHAEAHEHAVEVLSALLSERALPRYVEALSSDSPSIVSGVAEVLSTSDTYDATQLLEYISGAGRARSNIEAILAARGHSISTGRLISSLIDTNKASRGVVFRLLESHGDSSMAGNLLQVLRNSDWWLRLHALKLLGRFPSEEAIAGVAALLKDPNKNVRLEAVQALGKLKSRSAIPDLCQALRDTNLKVQSAAIDVLVDLGDISAVTHLLDVLKDESEQARRGAVEVLNEVATTDAIKDLVCALRDEDWWVQARAADALGTLGGDRVVEAVLGLMDQGDDNTRRYAVEILNTVPDQRAVNRLIQALDDPDWWVRERSIDALGKTVDPRGVDPLIDLMLRDPKVSALCAGALGILGDVRAVEPLSELIKSEDPEQSQAAHNALLCISQADIPSETRARVGEILGQSTIRRAPGHLRPLEVRTGKASSQQGGGKSGPERGILRESQPPGGLGATEAQLQRPGSRGSEEPAPAGSGPPQPTIPGEAVSAPVSLGPVRDLRPGTMLLNRYRVMRKIGSGGFGTVYLVMDVTVKDELILKVLSPHISVDKTMIQRFVHELKYARRITHKNIIRIYDLLDLEGGHAISMEFFPAKDLGTILEAEGHLEPARSVKIVKQICEGLSAAHSEGIIHRDIKPPNILVGEDNVVKVVDFGLAAMAQHAGSRLTKSGILIGTPQYMAPEQIKGDDADGRADIYSLGVMMYEMLSGQQPYQGDTAVNILFQHLEGKVRPLSEVAKGIPKDLEQLVECFMAKKREDRPSSVEECLEMIAALAA